MKDHTKVCWYCGSENVEPVETWYQCQDCGTTYTPLLTLGPDIIKAGYIDGKLHGVRRKWGIYHPTKAVTDEAAKIRQAKLADSGSSDQTVPDES